MLARNKTMVSEPRELIDALMQARKLTDNIFKTVPKELLYERPIRQRHRIAFYVGHLEAFDASLLQLERNRLNDMQAELDRLFAFGIDPLDGELPHDTPRDWPAITVIQHYVDDTRRRVDHRLMDGLDGTIDTIPLATLLNAVIEHRLMHAETLAYMLNRLPIEKPLRALAVEEARISDDDLVSIPAGVATLGAEMRPDSFAWDNEYSHHPVYVPSFAIDRYMVTNAQYRRFVDAGGYEDRRWWKLNDWEWRTAQRIFHPAAWCQENDEWRLLSRFDVIPMQANWPVYVSHAEACAYANWVGKQLPTEMQWHRAAYGTTSNADRQFPWGDAAPSEKHGNFDFGRWDPAAVDAYPEGKSAFGVAGLMGNGWEWTCTPFAGFPGFTPFAFYRGYSAVFFDGQHFVLKGGSQQTAKRLLRRSFRNWFQPHYAFPFAGFRCVTTQ